MLNPKETINYGLEDCSFCGKLFTSSNLQSHKRNHIQIFFTGPRPNSKIKEKELEYGILYRNWDLAKIRGVQ